MIENARAVETHLRSELSDVSTVKGILGKGCLLGIEFETTASEVFSGLLERKVIAGTSSDPKVLRLLPPLCVSKEELNLLVEALKG
jgi:acetylornithine/succinyldiaminopimelate/putrescine aminotransferase